MDVITECYVDALSDMAFLATGDAGKIKALMLKNHKEAFARVLSIYNLKAEARMREELKKPKILKPGVG